MTRSAYDFDVIIVGGGPAGASCAAFCAHGGLRTAIIERAQFPREKVCGDCLNPIAWPVLERLSIAERVLSLAHARLKVVEFIGCNLRKLTVSLPSSPRGEIAIKRSLFDQLLLRRAGELGAETLEERTVTAVSRASESWCIETTRGRMTARFLIAADGRNSTVARLLGLQPSAQKDRVGLQTHIPLPEGLRERVRMQFVPEGYTGLADIGEGQANLCLVARPAHIERLQGWAIERYHLPPVQEWRIITPLSRAPISPVGENVLLVGDAARVVEPFTGEGIAYALLSGELAAKALLAGDVASYKPAHARLYRGRLWVNSFAKAACLSPALATNFLGLAALCPALLTLLTRKVVGVTR